MSNVIQFLAGLGSQPSLSAAAYMASVDALDADPAHKRALLDRDVAAINGLAGGRGSVACMIAVPEEDGAMRCMIALPD